MPTYAQILEELKKHLGNVLTVEGLKEAAKVAARLADAALPGKSGTEKAAFAERWLLTAVEEYDNKIPVLGRFMDLPLVDGLEAAAVKAAVAWGYAAMELDQPASSSPIGQERGEVVGELAPSFRDVPPVELKDQ